MNQSPVTSSATPPPSWASCLGDPVLWAVLAVSAFLLLYQLGDRPYWQDEAETANLAVNVLNHGLKPLAFDGVNVISQEEGREFGPDYVWRWSPWMQIYFSALSQALLGKTTFAGRLPFALGGVACILLTYLLVRRRFGDISWARLSCLFLASSVPFLLFAKQGRYYSFGGVLALAALMAYRGGWRDRTGPLLVLSLSLALLFHANYLLFMSFAPCLLLGALCLYRDELPLGRLAMVAAIVMPLTLVPGLTVYGLANQSGMFNVLVVPSNLEEFFADLFMYIVPLPVFLVLAWRWGKAPFKGAPEDPAERFCLLLAILVIGGMLLMAVFPQRFHRYLVHLYPLCAIILAWCGLNLWRWCKPAGALFALLLTLTNWLNIIPMEMLSIVNRPWQNDYRQLTFANIPLRLYVTELVCGYPDVNEALIRFFNANAKPGDVIMAEYGDMVLQYYTPFRIIGGLQGRIPDGVIPDWVSVRRDARVNRHKVLFDSKHFDLYVLDLDNDYDCFELDVADQTFGNRGDPHFHSFVPVTEPAPKLLVYKRKKAAGS